MAALDFKHLITIKETDIKVLSAILELAETYIHNKSYQYPMLKNLNKFTVVNAFFEDSTRTRVSFELAAKRLGATVVNLPVQQSAMNKGETIKDTIETLIAMQSHFFVIRHADNHILEHLRHDVGHPMSLINAGTGSYAHPSQALLDILTIKRHKKNIADLSIAIVGDIKHSRVVSSQLALYKKLGVKDIRIIAPEPWMPNKLDDKYSITSDIKKGIADCDVINTLRIQKERILESDQMDLTWYRQHFQLNDSLLALAKPDAIILHPGPMNRDIEISSSVADGPQSCIHEQVTNGVVVRMAIFSLLAENFKD